MYVDLPLPQLISCGLPVWVVNHQVIRGMTTDETTETAFAWSLTLIAKIMVPWQILVLHGDLGLGIHGY